MNNENQLFWQSFNTKNFKKAQKKFDQLSELEKKTVFEKLFQQSQYHHQPHSISVLFRELREVNTFDEFHRAWFPKGDYLKTKEYCGSLYHQFFPVPIRVINAVNIDNPNEIVSVGLHWMTDEEATQMMAFVNNKKNSDRGDSIAQVADKTKSGIYKVESDDNLGTPF